MYLTLCTKVFRLHLGDNVQAEGRQGAAEGQAEGLAGQTHKHLSNKLSCEGLDGMGHLFLTDQSDTWSCRTGQPVQWLPQTNWSICRQQVLSWRTGAWTHKICHTLLSQQAEKMTNELVTLMIMDLNMIEISILKTTNPRYNWQRLIFSSSSCTQLYSLIWS